METTNSICISTNRTGLRIGLPCGRRVSSTCGDSCGYHKIQKNPRKPRVVRTLQDCSICYTTMLHSIVSQECGHRFHPRCLNRWFNQGKNTCPLCRAVLREPDDDDDDVDEPVVHQDDLVQQAELPHPPTTPAFVRPRYTPHSPGFLRTPSPDIIHIADSPEVAQFNTEPHATEFIPFDEDRHDDGDAYQSADDYDEEDDIEQHVVLHGNHLTPVSPGYAPTSPTYQSTYMLSYTPTTPTYTPTTPTYTPTTPTYTPTTHTTPAAPSRVRVHRQLFSSTEMNAMINSAVEDRLRELFP